MRPLDLQDRQIVALGLLLVVLLVLAAFFSGCGPPCQVPAATRCGQYGPEVCAGGSWRLIKACADYGGYPQSFACIENPGEPAACMPRSDP